MIHLTTRTLLAMALSIGTLAPTAAAGDWDISFGKHGRRGGVTIHVGSHGSYDSHGSHGRGRGRGRSGSHHHVHGRECYWEPAHYETIQERVWVAGYSEKVWFPDEFEITHDGYGNEFRRLVRPAHYEVVQQAGHYETRSRQVHVPARQICSYVPSYGHGYGYRPSYGYGYGRGRH